MNDCNICSCGHCAKCRKEKKCGSPCGCAEPVFSVEAMPDNPSLLRFNVNGKSVWYDFEPVIKDSETCTSLNVDATHRTIEYNGECSQQSIGAREIGAILHLGDLGDVDAETVDDYGILNYRKEADCGEGCEGINNGWVATNPITVGGNSLEYILGTDADGKMESLMPPVSTSQFSYLAWAGANKAKWTNPRVVTIIPNDGTYKYPLYLDPTTKEIVAYRETI